jgi:hypothetical protein
LPTFQQLQRFKKISTQKIAWPDFCENAKMPEKCWQSQT